MIRVSGDGVRIGPGGGISVSSGRLIGHGTGGGATVIPTGTLLEGFETFTGFTNNTAAPTVTVDPSVAVQGVNALRLETGSALAGFDIYKNIADFDPATLGRMAMYYVLDDDWDWQCNQTPTFSIRLNSAGTVYPLASRAGASQGTNGITGKHWIFGALSQANAAVAAGGVGNHRFQYRGSWAGAKVGSNVLDAAYYGIGGKGGVILSFDDAVADAYSIAFPIMAPLGIVGELCVTTSLVGTAGKYTWGNVATLAAAGWAVSLDGTTDTTPMTDKASIAAVLADLEVGQTELTSRGFPRTNSFCYPNGVMRTVGTKVSKASVTTDGNATSRVMTIADTTGITVGMRVIVFGASRTCRVETVSAGQIKTTEAIPVFTGPADFSDDSGAFHGNKLQTALKAAGYKYGRQTNPGSMFVQFGPAIDQTIIHPGTSSTGMTLTTFQTAVNAAIATGSVVNIYIHNIQPSGSLNWVDTEFAASMAWLKTQIDAGLVESLTTKLIETRYGSARPPV